MTSRGAVKRIKLPDGQIAIIDKDDYWIKDTFPCWRANQKEKKYVTVVRWIKTEFGSAREEYKLHRLVMKVQKNSCKNVDHINRNPLDNRKCNLRFASFYQNMRNRQLRDRSKFTSIYQGVRNVKSKNKTNPWMAAISIRRKLLTIGHFPTEKEAALAYNNRAKELFGDFAFQNAL